jgi:K+-sensing histidine kinase KdpD
LKRQPTILFYFLGAYVILQFSWWAYHIIQLTQLAGKNEVEIQKRIGMIMGEGLVFFLILIFGIWRIIRSIKKENELTMRQSNFMLSVTHELKTPLAASKLYMQTLIKHDFDLEKRSELLAKSLTENKRLEEIVDAILISARIENRTVTLHKENFKIYDTLKTILKPFEQNNPKIDFQLICNLSLELNSDLFIFKTIALNLIQNAIKYASDGEKIEVFALQEGKRIILRFVDYGKGIPTEKRKKIFQKFVRLENEETRTQKGTGLGLFIVKEFTILLGGQIKYHENKPQGSIFEIKI